MNLSGILVVTTQKQMNTVCGLLDELEGVDVFHRDEATARIIVVQEAATVKDEVEGLKRIKKLPGIVMAEMVHHYFGGSTDEISMEDLPTDLDELTGLATAVPAYLNDES